MVTELFTDFFYIPAGFFLSFIPTFLSLLYRLSFYTAFPPFYTYFVFFLYRLSPFLYLFCFLFIPPFPLFIPILFSFYVSLSFISPFFLYCLSPFYTVFFYTAFPSFYTYFVFFYTDFFIPIYFYR